MKFNILTKQFLKQKYLVEKNTLHKIAEIVGCNVATVFYNLKKYNIPRRTISEAKKGKHPSKETRRKMSEVRRGKNNSMYGVHKWGEKAPNWKGGRCKHNSGYIYVYSLNHPYADHHNYVLEHRLVVEKILGRYLKPEEVVHHINGIKDDNRIENLICFVNNSAHVKFHRNFKLVNSNEIIFDGRLLK